MTPDRYVNEIVLPTIIDFMSNPQSRRHAYLACIVTFQINDYLKAAGVSNTGAIMAEAVGDNYRIVRAVCNGSKHYKANSTHIVEFKAGDDVLGESGPLTTEDGDYLTTENGETLIAVDNGINVIVNGSRYSINLCVLDTMRVFKREFGTHLLDCDLSEMDQAASSSS